MEQGHRQVFADGVHPVKRHQRDTFLHPDGLVDVFGRHFDGLVLGHGRLPLSLLSVWVLSRDDALLQECSASIWVSQTLLYLFQEWVEATRANSLLQTSSRPCAERKKVREL